MAALYTSRCMKIVFNNSVKRNNKIPPVPKVKNTRCIYEIYHQSSPHIKKKKKNGIKIIPSTPSAAIAVIIYTTKKITHSTFIHLLNDKSEEYKCVYALNDFQYDYYTIASIART